MQKFTASPLTTWHEFNFASQLFPVQSLRVALKFWEGMIHAYMISRKARWIEWVDWGGWVSGWVEGGGAD